MPAIELSQVCKTYPDVGAGCSPVLTDVSLSVPEGQFIAITGPSGCGKTTLLNLLGAVDHATSGELCVLGVDLRQASDSVLARFRRQVGYVFQAFNLSTYRTALGNVLLPLAFSAEPMAAQRERARQVLAEVGLANWADRPAGVLSGGQRQRIALARALVTRPRLILADEPVGQLDDETRDSMVAVLRGYQHDARATVVVVTHETELVAQADVTLTLAGGRLVPAVGVHAG